MKTEYEVLIEVKQELDRFTSTLNKAIEEQKESSQSSHRNLASAKRGAMDLKNQLTKLTQMSKYIWDDKYLK